MLIVLLHILFTLYVSCLYMNSQLLPPITMPAACCYATSTVTDSSLQNRKPKSTLPSIGCDWSWYFITATKVTHAKAGVPWFI